MANEKILVVDDSPTELALMCAPLRASGFNVITAMDGEEAIEKAHAVSPKVIVLDVIMPKKNGYQVCRALKTSDWSKNIPMGRIGEPDELANLVVFLASDKSSYITGTTIQIDGGFVKGIM